MSEIEISSQKIKKISESLLENIRELSGLSVIMRSLPDAGISRRDANEIMPVFRELIDVISVKDKWRKDEIITLLGEVLDLNKDKRKK